MKPEDIIDAVGFVDDELIISAEEERSRGSMNKKSKKPIWISAAACAACLGIVGGIAAFSLGKGGSVSVNAHALAEAKYPEAAPYPNEQSCFDASGRFDSDKYNKMFEPWSDDGNKRFEAGRALERPTEFYKSSVKEFLSDHGGENRAYSPVNVYMALSLLAETTGGESRQQILSALGADSIEKLREQAKNMWTASYQNDGAATTILANSIWLSDSYNYNKDTLDTLADDYYSSSYSGDLASPEMTELLHDWINEQTGGLLKEAADGIELSPETVMTLCSTVYFRAKWSEKFSKDNNDTKTFHTPDGDINTEFMNRTFETGPYYWGEDYGAVPLRFENIGTMWFILPDEGKTVNDVLSSGEYLDMTDAYGRWANYKSIIVNFSVPKFDISSDININDKLKALGITDVFSLGASDFEPLTTDTGVYVSETKHAARVVIDEDGCTAAAFTAMMTCGAAMPPDEEIDFVLDRPFIFVITGAANQPLFTGVVNRP